MVSQLLFPILYIGLIGGIFSAFVRWNKKRQVLASKDYEKYSYFGPNYEKAMYLELTEQYSNEDSIGQRLLTTALMRRTLTAVERIMSIRDEKPALSNLVKQGTVGEDLWNKIQAAEKDMDDEVAQIIEEAEFYKPGWKDTIFQEATQLYQKAAQLAALKEKAQEETKKKAVKELTEEERRAQIEQELLREEEEEGRKKKQQSKKK